MKAYFLFLVVLILAASTGVASAMKVAPSTPVACPMIAKLCPDGTSVSPTGPHCEMPACPDGGDAQVQPPEPEPPEADDCNGDDCSHKPTDTNND